LADSAAMRLLDRVVTDLRSLQCVDVGGLGGQSGVDDLICQPLEFGVLGDEVGLGVELDQRAALGRDQTFGGRALGALADVLGALDAQCLDRPCRSRRRSRPERSCSPSFPSR
jgi:hypothetical protein